MTTTCSFMNWGPAKVIFRIYVLCVFNYQFANFIAAKCNGVSPRLFLGFLSSMFSIINLQTWRWPYPAASWSGVPFHLFWEVLFSINSIINLHTSKWLFVAAKCNGVVPTKWFLGFLSLTFFDYQFANCLRPNLTFIWGLVGYLEVSKILLAKQVEKNLIENRGFSPLHWASRNGHSKVCKILIENQAEKNVINTIGWTLLHWASCSRHSEVCKNCTWKLSGKNSTDNRRCTPLHFAAF